MQRWIRALATVMLCWAARPNSVHAQIVPVSCGCSTDPATNLGQCIGDIAALPADPLIPQRVVNDIFHTADGHDARSLAFGHYVRGLEWPTQTSGGGLGVSSPRYSSDGCPACACPTCTPTQCTAESWTGTGFAATAAQAHEYVDQLDWKWAVTYRQDPASNFTIAIGDLVRACPDINDVANCSYNPAYGLIWDLAGQANRVAIFAVTDHTDNCLEPFEWSVWLSDDATATAVVRDGEPPDPHRWNRARLDQIFLQGWTHNPNALGVPGDTSDLNDTSQGDALADSPTVVFSLPCGLTFRYVSVVSGNYGNPGPHCEFNSSEDEIDAVAGLNADNTGVCVDVDGDGFRDMACGGNDCNDHDPAVHPGALETCSTGRDVNCDAQLTACPTGTACIEGFCAAGCIEGACATGFMCERTDAGTSGCVPNACANVTCPAGQICGPSGCQGPCDGARCPAGQLCRGGACLDPCQGFNCPARQHCEYDTAGVPRCAGDCSCLPCVAPAVCNATSGRCDNPPCAAIPCAPPNHVDCSGPTPACVGPCVGVACPVGQVCANGQCARDACFGVGCQVGLHCDNGACVPDARTDGGTMDAGSHADASTRDGSSASGDARTMDGSDAGGNPTARPGCGCRTAGSRGGAHGFALAMTALAAAIARRRRHRARLVRETD